MQPSFSQLVWLGAHTAAEPHNLLQYAKRVTLFEAREAACLALQQKLPHEHIAVVHALLTAENQATNFTEYNLPEFSAIQPATGLNKLFPGLKALNTTPQTGVAVCDAISRLALNDDNNLLIVDIADSSLALLNAIEESNQLHSFRAIYIQTANEPLYANAATGAEVTAFLQAQGYVLQQTTDDDPDLPWLSFGLNPLWNTLQQAQQNNNLLNAELIQIKLQLNAAQQEVIVNKQQMESIHAQLDASRQELPKQEARINEISTALTVANKAKQDAEQQLAGIKQQLTAAQQELATAKQNAELEKTEYKQQLETANTQVSASKQELQKQEARLNETNTALAAANKAKQDAEQQLAGIKQQLTATQQELATAKQNAELAKTEHKQQLETANTQVSVSKQELQKQEARLNEINTALAAANKTKQDTEQQLATIKQQLTTAQQELETSKQTTEQAKSEHKQQLETANKAKQDAEQQLAAIKQQLTTAQQELATSKQSTEQAKSEYKQQLETANKAKQDTEQQLAAIKQQLTTAQQELATSKQTTEQVKSEHKQQLETANKAKQDAEQQLAAIKQQLTAAQQELTKTQQELAQTKTQLQQQQTEGNVQQALEQKLQKMFADQAQQLTKEVGNIKNHINSKLDNSTKQLEAFMGIQNYLERGVKPLGFHGWPISPDIGLYIAGLIDANNYDVIIEFGSGTSTVLMAKALISKQRGVQTKALANTSQSNEVAVQDQTFTDLPARIVTFEHNSLYHGKTTQALKDNGVEHLVDLVHAPLVDYQYKDGSQYLYYNCNEKLRELAKIFKGRKANILVLVDGPPGATNKNARFPALPHLLNTLPEHSFTIIMDDFNRAEEKEIMDLWKNILTERCMNPVFEIIPSEKGLSVLSTEQKN